MDCGIYIYIYIYIYMRECIANFISMQCIVRLETAI